MTISNTEGGTTTPTGLQEVPYGETVTFTSNPDEGYVLDSIVVNGKPVSNPALSYTTDPITQPTTIEVGFRKEKYNVVIESSKGGSVSSLGIHVVEYGDTFYITPRPDLNYKLDKILINGVAAKDITSHFITEPIKEDVYIKVLFKEGSKPTPTPNPTPPQPTPTPTPSPTPSQPSPTSNTTI